MYAEQVKAAIKTPSQVKYTYATARRIYARDTSIQVQAIYIYIQENDIHELYIDMYN